MRERTPRRTLALLLGGALALSACGDGGGEGEAETTEPASEETPADEAPEEDDTAEEEPAADAPEGEAAADDGWPEREITMIVPAGEGGGMDTTARRLQTPMGEELGTQIVVENQSGAGTTIGIRYFLDSLEGADECYGLVETNHPTLYIAPELFEDVDFSYDSLRPVGIPASNPAVWAVRNDAPWETFEELIEDARSRPGEITMSSSSASLNNHAIGVFDVMDATGVEFNIVPFADGGSAARAALVRGEVDFTHTGAYNRLSIEDETRVLAVQEPENEWPDITDDAPTVNEVLGTDLPSAGSFYGLQVHADCAENYPERYDQIVEAYQNTVNSDAYQEALAEVGEAGTVVDVEPDQMFENSSNRAVSELEALDKYGEAFQNQ